MLTALRMTWTSVDDLQWAVVRASLNTAALAQHGCLSWHSRRTGGRVHVSALWDDRYGAQAFRQGLLADVAAAARLEPPVVTQSGLSGMYASVPRASAAPAQVAAAPAQAAAAPAWPHRKAA